MRNVVLAVMLLIGITTMAQEKKDRRPEGPKMSKEERIDFQVKKMTKDLNLNEKQAKEVRAIVTQQVEKREAKRAEMEAKQNQRRAEMKARMEEMKKEQAAVAAEMKKVLSAEQYAKWEKMREERKDKVKEKVRERRGNRNLEEPSDDK